MAIMMIINHNVILVWFVLFVSISVSERTRPPYIKFIWQLARILYTTVMCELISYCWCLMLISCEAELLVHMYLRFLLYCATNAYLLDSFEENKIGKFSMNFLWKFQISNFKLCDLAIILLNFRTVSHS